MNAWGRSCGGALAGDGTTVIRSSPVKIGSATDWLSVSAGDYHTCGVKTGGTLWCWGFNYYGQLGDGTTSSRLSPIQTGLP